MLMRDGVSRKWVVGRRDPPNARIMKGMRKICLNPHIPFEPSFEPLSSCDILMMTTG